MKTRGVMTVKDLNSPQKILNDLVDAVDSMECLPYEELCRKKRQIIAKRNSNKKFWYSNQESIADIDDLFPTHKDAKHPYENHDSDYDDIFERLVRKCDDEEESCNDGDSNIDFDVLINNAIQSTLDSKTLKPDLSEKSEVREKTVSVATNPTKSKEPPSLFECSQNLQNKVKIINCNGKLFFFNGFCYDPADKNDIIRLYRQTVDDKVNYTKSLYNIGQLEQFLRSDPSIELCDDSANLRIAVLDNCIYDVEKQKAFRHTPDLHVFSYVNASLISNPRCPCFDQFLKDATLNNPVLIERIWSMLGYTIMQTNEAKVFFHMGEAPDSGKSLLGNFIQNIYPKNYVSNVPLHDFNTRFGPVRLVGSAVNISLDLPSTTLKSEAVSKIKMLTGGDYINVEEKCQPIFKYKNRAKLLFASNSPIRLSEDDDAFWNRLVYIPFDVSVPPAKQDPTLADKFMKEKDSIVSKALFYAHKLIKNGFVFPSTSDIDARIMQWKLQPVPTIDLFLKENCTIGTEFRGELVCNLYSSYEEYCCNKNLTAKSELNFKQYLEKTVGLKHFKMRDGGENPQSAFKGIKLNRKM